MTQFKEYFASIVAEVKAEQKVDEMLSSTQYHKEIDKEIAKGQTWNAFERLSKSTEVNVLSGYDRKYMDKNDFRFANKTRIASESNLKRKSFEDERWNMYFSQLGLESQTTKVRKIDASYDFDMSTSAEPLPWKKTSKKEVSSRASVKRVKALPQTYMPANPSPSTTKFTSTEILAQDGKRRIFTPSANSYRVVGYRIYRKVVVLDILAVDTFNTKASFDEMMLGIDVNSVDHTRDEKEKENIFTHLVFRYEPLTRTGKPNPYCGLTQLKNWLHSLKCITSQNPSTLKESLELLKGMVVDIPNAMTYNYSAKSDNLTVYTINGDIETFEDNWSESSTTEYTSISDYEMRDDDCLGYESLPQEIGVVNTKGLLKYDCHKEFNVVLPLEYSHISEIFD